MEKDFNSEKFELNIWKNFFKYLKPYKKEFSILILVMFCLSLLDMIFPLLTKYAIDNFIETKSIDGLGTYAMTYLFITICFAFIVYLFVALAGTLETKMAYDIRKLAFEKLQILPLSYYDDKAVGWLMSRMTSDISRLSETISWSIVDLASGASLMVAITISMLRLNVKLALIILSTMPFIALISFYFQKKILRAQREVKRVNSKITAAFNEDIQGAKTTKTLVREDLNLEEFSETTTSMRDKTIKSVVISSVYLPLIITIGSVGTALTLSIGTNSLLAGAISFGTLAAFITYSTQFYEPIRQIAVIFAEFQSAQASAERVFSLLNEVPEIIDTDEVKAKYGDSLNPKKDAWPEIKGHVEFKNVGFSYKNGETVLDNFNLKINAGDTIALVGETGSGKSTIVNLFCRFYEPTAGQVLIDGIDYKTMPQSWIHENLGYVLQSPHLFSGSIKENIRYGNLDATDEDIIEASKLVDAHDFIMDTEKGYETEVGEGGGLLSTGQKQLISFARAIVRKPKLFVLDEATSSIDTETEQLIQKAINVVLEGRTSFIIAHRLSTIKNADKILVIRDGKIQEAGTHKELIRQKGYYYNLYTNQFIEEQSKSLLDK